ncbi:MAG: HAD family hydrolase [Cyclobacteriaceae bacterium]
MLPKAVLFDFDGVIVNSKKVHLAAWSSAFLELFQKELLEYPHTILAGKSPLKIAEHLCISGGDNTKTQALFELKDQHIVASETAADLLPGVHEIQQFLATNHIPYGIASNATRQFLKKSIQQLQLNFETYTGLEDYKNPKPAPEAYESLAALLNIKEKDFENTWVCEDSLVGIQSAKSANMIPVGLTTVYSENQLRSAGAKLVFPTLKEAWDYLKSI